MKRKREWETDFAQWTETALRTPFEWGKFDCALMAASCIEALTGTHPRPDLIGAYFSPLGAARVLHAEDGLTGLCDALMPQVHVNLARRGDIVLGQFGRKESLMIDCGSQYLIAGQVRPVLVNKTDTKPVTAWRVG